MIRLCARRLCGASLLSHRYVVLGRAPRPTPTRAIVSIQGHAEVKSAASPIGLFRPTHMLRIPIPPHLLRLLATGSMLLIQAFAMAYQEKMREAQSAEAQHSAAKLQTMDAKEALALLGVTAPAAAAGSSSAAAPLDVPLTRAEDKQAAKRNFETLFSKATQTENLYLQGKLSCAYRLCVDPEWDRPK